MGVMHSLVKAYYYSFANECKKAGFITYFTLVDNNTMKLHISDCHTDGISVSIMRDYDRGGLWLPYTIIYKRLLTFIENMIEEDTPTLRDRIIDISNDILVECNNNSKVSCHGVLIPIGDIEISSENSTGNIIINSKSVNLQASCASTYTFISIESHISDRAIESFKKLLNIIDSIKDDYNKFTNYNTDWLYQVYYNIEDTLINPLNIIDHSELASLFSNRNFLPLSYMGEFIPYYARLNKDRSLLENEEGRNTSYLYIKDTDKTKNYMKIIRVNTDKLPIFKYDVYAAIPVRFHANSLTEFLIEYREEFLKNKDPYDIELQPVNYKDNRVVLHIEDSKAYDAYLDIFSYLDKWSTKRLKSIDNKIEDLLYSDKLLSMTRVYSILGL